MKPIFKLWIDNDGKVFGKGPLLLLEEVEKTGSLSEAAKVMGMSYNKAHTLIKRIEKNIETKLLIKKIGGVNGGSSTLTEEAKELILSYKNFHSECEEFIEKSFKKNFL
ncbi:MAG: LysR family transcriptional regulator [Clostridium sp.]|uniref:winged helix-turn-helix domain-containing protein n=1 Tax=Clostridium sp. TaxID=1506 RepID=UPI002FC66C8C